MREVALVKQLAPELPISVPRGKPNTKPAIEAAVRARQIDPVRAEGFIRTLYRLFWVQNRDVSDASVLRGEASNYGFPAEDLCGIGASGVEGILRSWEQEWAATEHSGVPIVEHPDRVLLVGLVPEDRIKRFLTETCTSY